MITYVITSNNIETNITGLPDEPVRSWDENIRIKFYHRGTNSYPTITETGKIKIPRTETQIYVNGKYFLQLSWNTTTENEKVITEIIKDLYCFGVELSEIKSLLKGAFYQK